MTEGKIKCWTHEIRDPDCPKCASETMSGYRDANARKDTDHAPE